MIRCGGTVKVSGGVIRSPGFPNLYPRNLNCTWHIILPAGYSVTVTFDFFKLMMGNDYLAIRLVKG